MKTKWILFLLTFYSVEVFSQPWLSQVSGQTNYLFGLYFTDSNTGYTVGLGGVGSKTTNGGTTWTPISTGVTTDLHVVQFTDANTGYSCGDAGKVLKTVNAGVSWTSLSTGTTAALRYLFFVDANTGFACGGGGKIIKTTDAGVTWSSLTTGTTQTVYGLYFTDLNNGIAVGSGGLILKTVNGGTSWTAVPSGSTSVFYYTYFTSATTGYAAGDNSEILKTVNGGSTWTALATGTSSVLWASIKFLDSNIGYAFGGNVSANTPTIIKTVDGGSTWSLQVTPVGAQRLSRGFIPSGAEAYVCGNGGTMLKTTGINASVSDIMTLDLDVVTYPNPYTEAFSLSFDLKESKNLKIALLDVQGKQISILADRIFSAGKQDVSFSGQNLPAGVYFLKIETEDGIQLKRLNKI